MEPSLTSAPQETSTEQSKTQHHPNGIKKPGHTNGPPPTILSEVAYSGPSKEDVTLFKAHNAAGHEQDQITIDQVVQGFHALGKEMTASELLTVMLRAIAEDESATLFEWVLWERFKDNPPADGKGHW